MDLLQVVPDPGWRDQAVKMLVHDMGDLSYMIEKFTDNAELLSRADALVESRASGHGVSGKKPRVRKKKALA